MSLGKQVTTYPMTKCNNLEDLNFQIDTVFIFITLCKCPKFDSVPYNLLFMMALMGLVFVLSKRRIQQCLSVGGGP